MAVDPLGDINANITNLVALLGSDGVYRITKTGVETPVRMLVSPVDKRDTEIINAYGVNGCRLTVKADQFTQRPAKFDTWTCAGRKYVFDTVSDILILTTIIGYTIYVKGTVG